MTYIDPRGKALSHLSRLSAWKEGAKPAPVTLEWDLSNRCYLGCQSCHFSYTHTRGPWVSQPRHLPMAQEHGGDLADFYLVSRALGEASRAGVKAVVWTGGGEPTTHPRWLDVVAQAQSCGLQQGMYTAGGLLTRESGRRLADTAEWVVVSLDAADANTYAAEKRVRPDMFDRACDGVSFLVGHKAAVGVSFLLHAENWHRVPEMLTLARSLGATYTTFRPTVQTSPYQQGVVTGDRTWIDVAMPLLVSAAQEPDVECDPQRFAEYRDWTRHPYSVCHGVKLNTTITPDGRMWLCPNRREFAGSCLGDLRTETFSEIWARHPGQVTDFTDCRAMCRLNPVNVSLSAVFAERKHEAFV
jgi:MoaA/NifB/PqqE/SkfB family radical SAM enzyme